MAFVDLVASTDRVAQTHLGGVPVVYAPTVGDPDNVVGIFDPNYRLVEPGEAGVEQVVPVVWLTLADLSVHPDNTDPTLTITHPTHGGAYTVRERKPDGMGTILLVLHRVVV